MSNAKKPNAAQLAQLRAAAARSDEEIEAAALGDPDNQPWTDEELVRAQMSDAPGKVAISLRVDADVLAAYKALGKGWQTQMNETLRGALPHKVEDPAVQIFDIAKQLQNLARGFIDVANEVQRRIAPMDAQRVPQFYGGSLSVAEKTTPAAYTKAANAGRADSGKIGKDARSGASSKVNLKSGKTLAATNLTRTSRKK